MWSESFPAARNFTSLNLEIVFATFWVRGAGGGGVPVGFRWGEIGGGHRHIFLDEDRVLALPSVARVVVWLARGVS